MGTPNIYRMDASTWPLPAQMGASTALSIEQQSRHGMKAAGCTRMGGRAEARICMHERKAMVCMEHGLRQGEDTHTWAERKDAHTWAEHNGMHGAWAEAKIHMHERKATHARRGYAHMGRTQGCARMGGTQRAWAEARIHTHGLRWAYAPMEHGPKQNRKDDQLQYSPARAAIWAPCRPKNPQNELSPSRLQTGRMPGYSLAQHGPRFGPRGGPRIPKTSWAAERTGTRLDAPTALGAPIQVVPSLIDQDEPNEVWFEVA
ncbi:hypothetical protein FB451DRAFT_1176796 [Mycena latifolia]|nr:hypothetical protein FB451DRAFT_1176796 [Mycena latifolia]